MTQSANGSLVPDPPAGYRSVTVNDVMLYLGLTDWGSNDDILNWPPDVFAAAGSILAESGGYMQAARWWPPNGQHLAATADAWQQSIQSVARSWTGMPFQNCPDRVRELWKTVRDSANLPLAEIGEGLWRSLVELCCIADDACFGAGVQLEEVRDGYSDHVQRACFEMLAKALGNVTEAGTRGPNTVATMCHRIHPSRAVVLPKMRTPQRGMTMRSLTLNLSLVRGNEIRPYWCACPVGGTRSEQATPRQSERSYNVLLVPWPFDVLPGQFRALEKHDHIVNRMAAGTDFFTYTPGKLPDSFDNKISELIRRAKSAVGAVHGLILPEMALTEAQFQETFKDGLLDGIKFLVCGIYEPATESGLARNYVRIRRDGGDGDEPINMTQHKHHRWALDESQINAYGMGGALHPDRLWWEGIDLPPRELHFVGLDDLCIFTVLICEDLARPDPAGDLLRAVGPNLVIALLQDGPQLAARWAARHATSLTDDPGCSVLTLTSLGMAKLNRPAGAGDGDPSRVVALWRDRWSPMRQLTLPPKAHGLVLSLSESRTEEFTADGRGDGQTSGCMKLAGVWPVSWD